MVFATTELYQPTQWSPLDIYKGEIVTICPDGIIAKFHVSSSEWRSMDGLKLTLATTEGHRGVIQNAVITSHNDTLYAVVQWKDERHTDCGWHTHKTTTDVFFYQPQSGWSTLRNLQSVTPLSANIIHTNLYISTSKTMYRMELVNQNSEAGTRTNSSNTLPQVSLPPHTASTLHTVKGNLFAFGGRDQDNQPSSDVLRYNPDSNTWESAGYMRSARYNVVVTTVQQDNDLDVFVFGGSFGNTKLGMRSKSSLGFSLDGPVESVATTPIEWDCSTCIAEKCMVE